MRRLSPNNGCHALADLERQSFDIVLMDVQMPDMNGFEVTLPFCHSN
jgi:CheY-like chemotaxis protein